MRRLLPALILLCASLAVAQSRDVLGAHDLSSGISPVNGTMRNACLYCHAPHSGSGIAPLWSQTLSGSTYSLYGSETLLNTTTQPPVGAPSTLCLSCHDGTVAPGQTQPYGRFSTTGTMTSLLGTKLEASHPFSMKVPLTDSPTLVSSLVASGTTADSTKAVKLVKGTIECTTCHDPHNQRIDERATKFLVRNNANGAICLSCHETGARTVGARVNPLEGWTASVHATSSSQLSPSSTISDYATVGETACQSCHAPHNAGARALLRQPASAVASHDAVTKACVVCHGGTDELATPAANILAEISKKGHPLPTSTTPHSSIEAVVPVQNRHATCADCHNSHAAKKVSSFGPGPAVRSSQFGVPGVAADGTVLSGPAANQFETCLRCHGNSTGKKHSADYVPARAVVGADDLNLILQFNTTAVSAHPVMRDPTMVSQPSLRSFMLNLSAGDSQRPAGARMLCTDCHNSDNNREFGGSAPNGPHGSVNAHILERAYHTSQVSPASGPGSAITNLLTVSEAEMASPTGPYALCAKCHRLESVMSDTSFTGHRRHIASGVSCSVCHSAHGVPAGSSSITGTRLVNFDLNVVAANGGVLSYSGATCTLTCHNKAH